MDILSLFVIVPVLTVLALVFSKGLKQVRIISMIGSFIQLGMAIHLLFAYFRERAVNKSVMLLPKIQFGLKISMFIMPLALTEFR